MQYNSYFLILQFLLNYAKALIGNNVVAVDYRQYPYVVCIAGTEDEILEENIWCTGALISFFHVLTSEHCVDDVENEPYRMILGSNDLYRGSSFYPAWWTSYDKWSTARNVRLAYSLNDVAVIKLIGTTYPLMRQVATISSLTDRTLLHGRRTVAIGWGTINDDKVPTYLQGANLTIITKQQCEQSVRDIAGTFLIIHERYICSIANPYSLLGEGDSGGPLLYDGNIVALHKATSPQTDSFNPNVQNVHILINYYKAFIDSALCD